jgi:hypothetical protein
LLGLDRDFRFDLSRRALEASSSLAELAHQRLTVTAASPRALSGSGFSFGLLDRPANCEVGTRLP